ncbi:hypothetical protein BV25DRAFT_1916615 [Artomyces pyxidatus]|uniref:Uncharacterized protein n=2 Tax=Artomyces pyxidatus TaxID=48021 RepID=A0ACB8T0L2_9AGAM|nr:hypothetical protein BV25DRAFT_1922607 [Artomyces pyxidatus]KAI0061975.1 hypothetical protein BV25DRAFT_1916615 [Artomyces pyxidatus]
MDPAHSPRRRTSFLKELLRAPRRSEVGHITTGATSSSVVSAAVPPPPSVSPQNLETVSTFSHGARQRSLRLQASSFELQVQPAAVRQSALSPKLEAQLFVLTESSTSTHSTLGLHPIVVLS